MTKSKVLFLDDMEWRHEEFQRLASKHLGVEVHHVWTAAKAIEALESQAYDQVFLDHDLSESDIMVEVGGPSSVPTGMEVVDHIAKSGLKIPQVVIHSCNGPAALEMERRLLESGLNVQRCAFPILMYAMQVNE